jgi:hypothetical protein
MEAVKTWLRSLAADFFDMGIQNLILLYDKCLSSTVTTLRSIIIFIIIICGVGLSP